MKFRKTTKRIMGKKRRKHIKNNKKNKVRLFELVLFLSFLICFLFCCITYYTFY